ncbi:phosphoesterase family-domain-containing protein [Umbelopsis sp. AD052]|nr:phosphoesterase family-domain-containing protein [Umbelopsis sp. AD052]
MVAVKFITAITLALAAAVSAAPHGHKNPSHHQKLVRGKYFDRFMVVVLENQDYEAVVADPYFGSLAKKHHGNLLTNYLATTHPSEPNYIAMIGGSTFGNDDDSDVSYNEKSIVDILEPRGITWKEYAEDYIPGPNGACAMDSAQSKNVYRRKHNPFISFSTVTSNPARCKNIVPGSQLAVDLKANNLPQFMFYTPNMNNDGHDTTLAYASNWTHSFIEPLLANKDFTKNTAVLLTWDESKNYSNTDQVWSVLVGGAVKAKKNNVDNTKYDHYSILATIEKNWKLPNLGQNDANATAFKW